MIYVTKSYLPAMEEYTAQLERIWASCHITNRGKLVLELEEKLKNYLGVQHIIITNNGTVPIQIAMQALDVKGDVITTPFSYVATTSSILWEKCKPVFVDIHPEYLTIDEAQIEAAITPSTSAILATHVFGNPCNVEEIDRIAKKHGLKVIYDAAHSFGVTYKGQSVFNYGDVSTCSFHATKLFHTGEGGAMFCNDKNLYDKLFYMHNFGHNGPYDFQGIGINAKISELQSAMGLAVFSHMGEILESRKKIVETYLDDLQKSGLEFLSIRKDTTWNYCYFPVIFPDETTTKRVMDALIENEITPRRYFYPSLNKLKFVESRSMPVSESISSRVLCLPLYPGLAHDDVSRISRIIHSSL